MNVQAPSKKSTFRKLFLSLYCHVEQKSMKKYIKYSAILDKIQNCAKELALIP